MTTELTNFVNYNLWANLCMLDACAQLTDAQLTDATAKGVYGSVRDTLVHILSSEQDYVRDLTGNSPTPRLDELTHFPGFDELRRYARWSAEELITAIEQKDLLEVLDLDRGTYKAPGIILLIQVVSHGADHRSQIATVLSLQGIQIPRLDGWGYNNAMRKDQVHN